MLGMKYGDFYSAQILLLMGHNNAAELLMKHAKIPNWINGVYQGLNQKFMTVRAINQDSPENALIRANKLAAKRQFIQAIALFEELITIYPDVSIFTLIIALCGKVWVIMDMLHSYYRKAWTECLKIQLMLIVGRSL